MKIRMIIPVILLAFQAVCAGAIEIVSGPYIQNMTETGCDVLWRTDRPATAWVELAPDDGTHFYLSERPRIYSTDLGRAVVGTFHKVSLTGLKPGTSYRYRIFSEEVTDMQPYHVSFGGVASSKVYPVDPPCFRTVEKNKKDVEFVMINDIHGKNDVLSDLLANVKKDKTDFVLFNGDMVDFMDSEDRLFSSFIDTSVNMFAKEIPTYVSRGNHETRGAISKDYMKYFPNSNGKPYYSFKYGPCYFVVLDGGEDKPDSDIEYSGTSFFDDYRKEEAAWLRETVESEEFRNAPYRIAVIHVPTVDAGWHGPMHARQLFEPILNNAGIDLMLCGHLHSYSYHEPDGKDRRFPVLINSNQDAVVVNADTDKMKLKVLDRQGKLLHQFEYPVSHGKVN